MNTLKITVSGKDYFYECHNADRAADIIKETLLLIDTKMLSVELL